MCATCGCGKPKDKHGMKTLAAANKKYNDKKDGAFPSSSLKDRQKKAASTMAAKKNTRQQKATLSMNRKKGM